MFGLPPIDAPTAAILGGISGAATGFLADNITGVIQRQLEEQNREKNEKIRWYENLIQITNEIHFAAIINRRESNIDLMDLVPDEEQREVFYDEAVEGMIEDHRDDIRDAFDDREQSFEEIVDMIFSSDDFREAERRNSVLSAEARLASIGELKQQEMRELYHRLSAHLARGRDLITKDMEDPAEKLLTQCRVQSVFSWINDNNYEEILECGDELIAQCEIELSILR